MRHRRGQSILQIEGIERLETRITPTASANASLMGQIFSSIATTTNGLGDEVTESIDLAGGRAWGDAVSAVARIPR